MNFGVTNMLGMTHFWHDQCLVRPIRWEELTEHRNLKTAPIKSRMQNNSLNIYYQPVCKI